ncbi:dicarboxylate/amino acid:cation symporter [Allochromatium tepidum]|uniref:Sodium:dicarboxylate symporter n=1 Tax=Allochromatium tepidum TaxID=553982 RepID=A0ABN6GAX4_9GAMM|nr:cation:dicarboxylase symporter family transporter [Allochromatium tepidum]BCU07086.1 sodium:dicarboxylate symporter [Allochromatium tepidum]
MSNDSANTFINLALNPWVILASLLAGLTLGVQAPQLSSSLAPIGDVYLDLMKMIVLPFMMSAVILSVYRLIREGSGSRIFVKIILVFVLFSLAAAVVGIGTMMAFQPGSDLPQQTLDSFGDIVGENLGSADIAMQLNGSNDEKRAPGFSSLLLNLIPSNIFKALVNDEILKVLVFSVLLGFAIGRVPNHVSVGLTTSLETVYRGCQTLMHWMTYLLPVVLLCMSAGQIARSGLEPLPAMAQFFAAFTTASILMILLSLFLIWQRAQLPLKTVVNALRGPFALAIATRNSVICMPIMIESLTEKLHFSRSQVELLVPLSVSLLRLGPTLYYVCATLFIAQLYGHEMTIGELMPVMAASIMAGFASAGMTGFAIVSLIGVVCGYLGLPFEAAIILFLAIDPICDILRTLVLVIANTASVALICATPETMETEPCAA